jgi:hypothetical protein
VNLLLAPFQGPLQFAIFALAIAIAGGMVFVLARAAMTPEDRSSGFARAVTNVNAKFLFGFLFIGWAVVFGVALQVVPHEGANSPYGGLALIAMFTGFFVMMGFLWAVIGE